MSFHVSHLSKYARWVRKTCGAYRDNAAVDRRYAAQEPSLPIYAGMPDAEVTAVIEAINSFEVTL